MNDTKLETLAEIRGFFCAFEWVNGKTNHGYCFEITLVPMQTDLEAAVEAHFAKVSATRLSLTPVEDWHEMLSQTLVHWLLAYLIDAPVLGRLTDQANTFTLSMSSCHKEMIDPLIGQIDSLSPIQSAHSITVETERFYACEYTDLVLTAADHLVFLHFDVCD